jgi:hypothetical protein
MRAAVLGPVMAAASAAPVPVRKRVCDRAREPPHGRLVADEDAEAQHQDRQQEDVLDCGLAAAHLSERRDGRVTDG